MNWKLAVAILITLTLWMIEPTSFHLARGMSLELVKPAGNCFSCQSIYQMCLDANETNTFDLKFYTPNGDMITYPHELKQETKVDYIEEVPTYKSIDRPIECMGILTYDDKTKTAICTIPEEEKTIIEKSLEPLGEVSILPVYTPYDKLVDEVPVRTETILDKYVQVEKSRMDYVKIAKPDLTAKPQPRCFNISVEGNLQPGQAIDNVLCLGETCFEQYDWWNASWTYSRLYQLNSTVATTLTDFPAYISIDTASLISVGKMNNTCSDIRVLNDSNSELSYDIENCNAANTIVWIKIPALVGGDYTNVTLYYGLNGTATTQSGSDTFSNGFVSVYHGDSLNDLFNRNNLTATNSVTSNQNNASCKMGVCMNFAKGAYLTKPSAVGLPSGSNASTVTYWYKATQTLSAGTYPLFYGTQTNTQGIQLLILALGNYVTIGLYGTDYANIAYNATWSTNTNYYGGVIYINKSMVSIFNNSFSPPLASPTMRVVSDKLVFGHSNPGDNANNGICGNSASCLIDEVRFANVSRTNDWIKAEYGQTFINGTEQTNAGGDSISATIQSPANTTYRTKTLPLTLDLKYTVQSSGTVDKCYLNPTSPSSGWCYQETANVSTACGGLDTGYYNITMDGSGLYFVNYTKPTGTSISSLFQVKYGYGGTTYKNFTIPSGCWNLPTLLFKFDSHIADTPYVNLSCYNGSGWLSMNITYGTYTGVKEDWDDNSAYLNDGNWDTGAEWDGPAGGTGTWEGSASCGYSTNCYGRIYEEAMHWYIPVNFSMITGGTLLTSCANSTRNLTSAGSYFDTIWSNTTTGVYAYTNVSYVVDYDTTPPTVAIISPSNGQTISNFSQNITYPVTFTVSNTSDTDKCWYSYNGTTTYPGNCNNFTMTLNGYKSYTLVVFANDTLNNIANDTHTFTLQNISALTLTQDSPADAVKRNYTTLTIKCNASVVTDTVDRFSFKVWNPSNTLIQWFNTTDKNTTYSYTFTLPSTDGTYKWMCLGNTTPSNANASTANRTVLLDLTTPIVSIISPTHNQIFQNLSNTTTIPLTFVATDTNRDTCWYDYNGTTTYPGNCNNFTMTMFGYKTYNVRVWSNDTFGNVGTDIHTFILQNVSALSLVHDQPANGLVTDNTYMNLSCNVSLTTDLLDTLSISLYKSGVLQNKTTYTYDSDLVAYYPFSSDANDYSGNDNDGTVSGATLTAGKYGGAYAFDCTGTSINLTKTALMNLSYRSFSISVWVYANVMDAGHDGYILVDYQTGQGGVLLNLNNLNPAFSVNNGTSYNSLSPQDIPMNEWVYIVATYELNGNTTLYVNGELKDTDGPIGLGAKTSTKPITIGRYYSSSTTNTYWNGTIDEVKVWNRALTASEIEAEYLSSSPGYIDTTTAYALDLPVTDGNYTWFCSANSSTKNATTTNWTFVVDTTPPVIAISQPTAILQNTSQNITTSVRFTATDSRVDKCWYDYNGTTTYPGNCNNFSITLNGYNTYNLTVYANDTVGNSDSELQQFIFQNVTGLAIAQTSPADALLTNVTPVTLVCSAVATIDTIDTFRIRLFSPAGTLIHELVTTDKNTTYSYTTSLSSGDGIYRWMCLGNTTPSNANASTANRTITLDTTSPSVTIVTPSNGQTIFNVSLGITYPATFRATDTNRDTCWYDYNGTVVYSCNNFSMTLNTYQTYNLTVWSNDTTNHITSDTNTFIFRNISINTLVATIYNEENGEIIYDNFTLEAVSVNFSTNYSGSYTFEINDILEGEYTLRYGNLDYVTRNFYQAIAQDDSLNIKLYTLNNTKSLLTLFTISDTAGVPIQGATLSVLRKIIPTNAWETVEMAKSDINGQGTLNLQPYNVNYMFQIDDLTGSTIFVSSFPQVIPSNTIYFNVNLFPDVVGPYYTSKRVIHSLKYNNATGNYTFTWSDPVLAVSQANLVVTRSNSLTSSIICNATGIGYLGQNDCDLSEYINDTTSTYTARGLVLINSTWYEIDAYTISFDDELVGHLGLTGAFYALLIIGVFAMFGIWNPAATVGFAAFGMLVSVLFGLIPLSSMYMAGIMALAAIAIWMVNT